MPVLPPGKVQAALGGAASAADQYRLRAAELLFTPKGLVWMKGRRGARVHRLTGPALLLGASPLSVMPSLFMEHEQQVIQAEEVLLPQFGGSPVRKGNRGGMGFGSGFWAIRTLPLPSFGCL